MVGSQEQPVITVFSVQAISDELDLYFPSVSMLCNTQIMTLFVWHTG